MKLKLLLQSFEFDDLFPSVITMYPNARRHKREFEEAFNILTSIRATPSDKNIRYALMDDPYSDNKYFGANDQNFRATWDVLAGKEVKRAKGVDLSDEELAANCLINAIFIGRYPREFEESFRRLTR